MIHIDSKIIKNIDNLYIKSRDGKLLNEKEIISLLEIDSLSEEVKYLGKKARLITEQSCNNKGKIWAAIGLDYGACKMNCSFCSLGEKWIDCNKDYYLTDDEILKIASNFNEENVEWIVLRTTEFYPLEKIAYISKMIKNNIRGKYKLSLNSGNDNTKDVELLKDLEIEMVYHAIRLGEEKNTHFKIKDRLDTINEINKTDIALSQYLEPIGPEHGNEELAKRILGIINQKTKIAGVMPRVPVKNTPMYKDGAISDERVAQLVAILRLVASYRIPDIVVHPCSELGLDYGANVIVVDTGAIPRETNYKMIFDENSRIIKSKEILKNHGYKI